jgi:hypothetical protein
MAVSVNYNNANPELGIYGAYNPFMVLINWTGATPYYLTYKIKVTALNNTTVVEKPVSPTSGYFAQVNPLELIKEAFFKSEYNGTTEHSQPFSYSQIKIEVGASFSTAQADPPTFAGYTESDTFYVYNGYELQPTVLNYRDPAWYDTFPTKLPKVKKTLYLLENDIELLSFPSKIPTLSYGLLSAKNLVTTFYNSSNTIISQFTIDLTVRPDLTATAYWNININSAFPSGALYSKSKINYIRGEGADVDSEEITIYRAECNPKQDRYRLYFVNRYGGAEYENFTLAATTSYNIKKGKQIQSDGINYKATTFADIQNINNPNLQEFGNSTSKNITIRRDYFKTQEEVDSLAELFKSAVVIMFDAANTAFPMIVETSNYDQDLISQNLYKVDVRLLYANNELQQIQ